MNALAPSPATIRKALPVHAAIGLLAGALIYILCLTGTLAVLDEEWQRWEQPNVAEMEAIAPAAVQRAAKTVLASEADRAATTHLWVHLPSEALPRTVVTTDNQAVYVNGGGAAAAPEAHRWTEMLLDIHYYLHLPPILGLTLVGGLGVMLVALGISGILAHPRLFRDAFRLRARGGGRVALTDWHNRLGVWTLPFSLAVALTGALLGLASIMAFAMAETYEGGERAAVFASIFGAEPEPDTAPAPLADIIGPLAYMAAEAPEVMPTYVIVHDPATAGQHVQVMASPPRSMIFGEYYSFSADGEFRGAAGLADGTAGQQMAASVYGLHFGDYGGLAVKLAYVAMGLAVTVVSGTGMSIWLAKRRQRGRASPRLEGFWAAILWGTPIMLAATLGLRLAAGPGMPLAVIFWAGLAALIGAGMMWGRAVPLAALLRGAAALLLAALAAGHILMAPEQPPMLLGMNAALLIAAALLARAALNGRQGAAPLPRGEPSRA